MVTAIIILSIIGLISATLLYIISRKFHVEEDSRIDEIESILPGANCGGCGYAGCRNFAEQCTKVTSRNCMSYGPGSLALAHKPNEYVPHADIVRCQQVLIALADNVLWDANGQVGA